MGLDLLFTRAFNAQVSCRSNLNPPAASTTVSPLINIVNAPPFNLYIGNNPSNGQIVAFYWFAIGY